MGGHRVAEWRSTVADKVAGLQWDRVISDVRPFLERPEELSLLTRENLLRLLGSSGSAGHG